MLYMLYEKIKWQAWMITSLISGFLGWLFLILAPGNSARASSEEVGWSFFAIVYNRLLTAIKMWQVSFVLMLAVYVVLFIIAIHTKAEAKQIHLSVIMLFTAFACNFAMLGTPLYPDRASMGVFVFLLLACGILFQCLKVEWFTLVSQCAVGVIVLFALSDAVVASEAIIQCHSLYQDRTAEILACKAAGETEVESYTINSTNEKSIYYTLGWADTRLNYEGTSYFAIYHGLEEVNMPYDVYYGEAAEE